MAVHVCIVFQSVLLQLIESGINELERRRLCVIDIIYIDAVRLNNLIYARFMEFLFLIYNISPCYFNDFE